MNTSYLHDHIMSKLIALSLNSNELALLFDYFDLQYNQIEKIYFI